MMQSISKRHYDSPQNTFWTISNPNDAWSACSGIIDDNKQKLAIMLQGNVTLGKILRKLHPEADKNLANPACEKE